MKVKNYILLLLVITVSVSLIFTGKWAETVELNNSLPVIINKNLIYQSITLLPAIFGIIHFWGTPGGFFGILFAGFLGWLLSKSIIETRGVY